VLKQRSLVKVYVQTAISVRDGSLTSLWEQCEDYAAYCTGIFKILLMFPDRNQAAEQSHHLPEEFQKEATPSFVGHVNTRL